LYLENFGNTGIAWRILPFKVNCIKMMLVVCIFTWFQGRVRFGTSPLRGTNFKTGVAAGGWYSSPLGHKF